MAEHSTTNLISKVQLPGSTTQYEIHDAKALHNLADITALIGDTLNLMNFKGTVTAKSSLPTAGNAVGDVYYVVESDSEWIWVDEGKASDGTTVAAHWEEMGSTHNHVHAATLSGTASVTVPQHNISVTGNITPAVSATKKYISASAPTVTPTPVSVLPANASFTTTVTPTTSQKGVGTVTTKKYKVQVNAGTAAAVAGNGTATVLTALGDPTTGKAITGFGAHTTANAATALNTTSIVPIASNTPVVASKVTLGDPVKVTPTYKNGFSTYFNVSDGLLTITAPVFNEFAVPSITSDTVNASLVTSGSATTVATGIKSTAKAITALGTPTYMDAVKSYDDLDTAVVLTGVKVATQPTYTASIVEDSTNGTTFVTGVSKADITISAPATTATSSTVDVLSSVAVAAPALNLSASSSTGAVQVVTAASGSATSHTLTGTVAAQTATGTASVSGDTGGVKTNTEH